MQPALLIRLRPAGPWRYGPGDGASDRVDTLFRSDRLFSALTIAMRRLGYLEEWLDATARAREPQLAFGSLFPFQGETLFAIPPFTLWPPPPGQVTAPSSVFLAKLRWKTARFVPLSLIDTLATGSPVIADQWLPDPESGCLLRRDRPSASPFRTVVRRGAAVDRLSAHASSVEMTACVEFEPGAGLWTLVRYSDSGAENAWNSRVEAAFRLLADSGFGGHRSSGWGHAQAPEFERGTWPSVLLPKLSRLSRNGSAPNGGAEGAKFWLLSLFSPGITDQVDWSGGVYDIATRTGRIESEIRNGLEKKSTRMVTEGSVLVAKATLAGAAVDVAPEGFEHAVYRSGLALALELPAVSVQTGAEVPSELRSIEEPTTEEAVIERPCDEPAAAGIVPEKRTETMEPEQQPEPELPVEVDPQPDPETASEPPVPAADAEQAIVPEQRTETVEPGQQPEPELPVEVDPQPDPETASEPPVPAVDAEQETTGTAEEKSPEGEVAAPKGSEPEDAL